MGLKARARVGTVALLVLGTAVAGCASGSGGSDEETTTTPMASPSPSVTGLQPFDEVSPSAGAAGLGLPEGAQPPASASLGAGWAAQDGLLYVVTFGSSTCPVVVGPEATVETDGTLTVPTVEEPEDRPCTMDYVPATSVVGVPSDVDASLPVTVVTDDGRRVDVPVRATAGEAGEIGWLEE